MRLSLSASGRMPGTLQRLPRHLQHQPLLRVHRHRLARRDAEEPRVEVLDRVTETAFLRQPSRHRLQSRNSSRSSAPATGRRLAPALQQRPVALRARQTSRRAAAHPHDRDRLVVAAAASMARRRSSRARARPSSSFSQQQLRPSPPASDSRTPASSAAWSRPAPTGGCAARPPSTNPAQAPSTAHPPAPTRPGQRQHRRDVLLHQLHQRLSRSASLASAASRARKAFVSPLAADARCNPLAASTRYSAGTSSPPSCRCITPTSRRSGNEHRLRPRQRRIQKLKPKLERQRQHALPAHPQQLRPAQVRRHARPLRLPQAPHQAQPGKTPMPALRRQRIQEHIRRRVVRLARDRQAPPPTRTARTPPAPAPPSARAGDRRHRASAAAHAPAAPPSAPAQSRRPAPPPGETHPSTDAPPECRSRPHRTASRSDTSQLTTCTVCAPSACSAATSSGAPGVSSPRRDVSSRCRTP